MSITPVIQLEYVNYFFFRMNAYLYQGKALLDAAREAFIETAGKYGSDLVREFLENVLRAIFRGFDDIIKSILSS